MKAWTMCEKCGAQVTQSSWSTLCRNCALTQPTQVQVKEAKKA